MSFSLSYSHFPGFPYFRAHAPTFAASKPKQHSSSKNQIHRSQAGTCPMSSLERPREASVPSDQPPNSRSSFILPVPAPAQASPPLISPTCGPWVPYQYHHCAVVHELLLVLLASPCIPSWCSNLLEALSNFFIISLHVRAYQL